MSRMGQFCMVHAVAFPLLSHSANESLLATRDCERPRACPPAKPAAWSFRVGQAIVRYAISLHWVARSAP